MYVVQADAPKNRGILRDHNQEAADRFNNYVNCSISQWGVGAKTAGFYLGSSITVITCPSNADDDVFEINLSKEEMEKEFENTGNAFKTTLYKRKLGQLDRCIVRKDALDNPQIRAVLEEERRPDCRHFTRFLISTDAPSDFLLESIRGWRADKHGPNERRESDGSFMSLPTG